MVPICTTANQSLVVNQISDPNQLKSCDIEGNQTNLIYSNNLRRNICDQNNVVLSKIFEESKLTGDNDKDIFDPEPYSTEIPQIKFSKLSKRKRRKPVLFDKRRYKERSTSRYGVAKISSKSNKGRHYNINKNAKVQCTNRSILNSNCRMKKHKKKGQNFIHKSINAASVSQHNDKDDELINELMDPVPYSTRIDNSNKKEKAKSKQNRQRIVKNYHSDTNLEINDKPNNVKNIDFQVNPEKTLSTEAEQEIASEDTKNNKLKELLEVRIEPSDKSNNSPEEINICESISEESESLEISRNSEIKTENENYSQINIPSNANLISQESVFSISKDSEDISYTNDKISSIRSFSGENYEEENEGSSYDQIAHFSVPKGFIINNFKILEVLGEGTFGRVFYCRKIHTADYYALKIVRPKKKYIEAAKYEAEILKEISSHCSKAKKCNKDFQSHCIELYYSFKFESPFEHDDTHVCLVFESLGKSLYEFIKENDYRGFYIEQILTIAKQMFQALEFIHSIGIIHTDIKPENILFQKDEIRKTAKTNEFPKQIFIKSKLYQKMLKTDLDENTLISPYIVTEECKVKLIDFGGAIKKDEHHGRTINTRQYRSPEVIMGCCEWNEKSDIWSMGCVLFELYAGEMLFPTHDDYEHLAMIEKIRGPLELWMTENAGAVTDGAETQYWDGVFTEDIILSGESKWEGRVRWDCLEPKITENLYIETIPLLEDIILPEHQILLEILKYTLTIDPNDRPSAKQVIDKFFN